MTSQLTANIASGTALSQGLPFDNYQPVALVLPSAWTAALVTFQTSVDGVTWKNLYNDNGDEVAIQADVDRHVVLSLPDLLGIRYLRMRSGTAATPVSQGQARVLTLTVRHVER